MLWSYGGYAWLDWKELLFSLRCLVDINHSENI